MAVVTTGSLVKGTITGLGLNGMQPSMEIIELHAGGEPDGVLSIAVGSQIAFNGSTYFMGVTQNGSTWVDLGSVA